MRKILVLVDLQNDFVSPNGTLTNSECKSVVNNIISLINNSDANEIYLTQDTHYDDYFDTLEGKKLPIEHCKIDSWGWEINNTIQRAIDEKEDSVDIRFIEKASFGYLDWRSILDDSDDLDSDEIEDIDEITIAGVCTGICVLANAVILRATYPDTKIVVPANCCADVSPEMHKVALQALKMQHIDVI